jgi:hypothetical protein
MCKSRPRRDRSRIPSALLEAWKSVYGALSPGFGYKILIN